MGIYLGHSHLRHLNGAWIKVTTSTLLLGLASCIPGTATPQISDKLRSSSGGSQIVRNTDPSSCPRIKPHAQNIIIQWARNRMKEGRSVSVGTASALMGLGSVESGGGKGLNFANVTMHGNEGVSNQEGDDLSSFGKVTKVESFLAEHAPSNETNFGGVQISPNVVGNYKQQNNFMSFINQHRSVASLYASCLTDMAYVDKGNAMHELDKLFSQRDQIPGWITTVHKYTNKNQIVCQANEACSAASAQIGRWLAYCPKLNLDMAAVVYNSKPNYFGTLDEFPGNDPKICMDMIGKEIQGPNPGYNDENANGATHGR